LWAKGVECTSVDKPGCKNLTALHCYLTLPVGTPHSNHCPLTGN